MVLVTLDSAVTKCLTNATYGKKCQHKKTQLVSAAGWQWEGLGVGRLACEVMLHLLSGSSERLMPPLAGSLSPFYLDWDLSPQVGLSTSGKPLWEHRQRQPDPGPQSVKTTCHGDCWVDSKQLAVYIPGKEPSLNSNWPAPRSWTSWPPEPWEITLLFKTNMSESIL